MKLLVGLKRKVANKGLDLYMLIILNQSRVSYPRRSGLVGKRNRFKDSFILDERCKKFGVELLWGRFT